MRRIARAALPLVAATLLLVSAGKSWAQGAATPPADEDPSRWLKELDVEAGALEADLRLRELDLSKGVKVRLSPYYLRADRIHLSLGTWGVRVSGHGVLTFCPCDEPPIGIGFSGGWAGPPDELIVEDPTLRVFGLPVFWLPYLWLRSPRKVGLTVPDLSYRGKDGFFFGQGVHIPVARTGGASWSSGLELGAGVYTRGGYAAWGDLATEGTTAHARLDWRPSSLGPVDEASPESVGVGLALDAHGEAGALASTTSPSLVWDTDALRGARGLRTTLELEPVARPFDRLSAEAMLGPLGIGFDALDRRGGPLDRLDYARPFTSLGHAFSLGSLGGAAARGSFGPRFLRGRRADAIGEGSLEMDVGAPVGVAMMSSLLRVDGRAARGGGDEINAGSPASAILGEARLEASLPLARALEVERAMGGPPVLHVVEPLVRAAGVMGSARGDREALAGFVGAPALDSSARLVSAAMVAVGARTSIGTVASGLAPGRDPWIGKLAAELTGGALAAESRRDAMLGFDLSWITRHGDGGGVHLDARGALARSVLPSGADVDRSLGWIALGRARVDTSRDGLGLELRAAARGPLSVVAGWAMLGAEVAPRLATATGLALPGTTLGAGTSFPLGGTFRVGGDVDLYAASFAALAERAGAQLLDVRSSVRYRHPCGCFRLTLRGGHLVGREGIDVSATIELARAGPEDRP